MRRSAVLAVVLALAFSGLTIAKMLDPGEIHFVLLRDGIPALTEPSFREAYVAENTMVIGVAIADDARAYPLAIMSFHEIVNDVVGDTPVAVTYCPLCGTGIVFDRRVGELALTFKVSGRLLQNNLVMYDVETSSQWSQLLGEAITGALSGTRLEVLSSAMLPFGAWQDLHPSTKVLAPPDPRRAYGADPYASYYSSEETLFPIRVPDRTMHPKAFVQGVDANGVAVAFPYEVLSREVMVNTEVAGVPVAVTYQLGFVSVWERGGRTFAAVGDVLMRDDAGATWNRATGASLDGSASLTPVPSIPSFWFSWKDFHPNTRVYGDPTPYDGAFNSGFLISSSFLVLLLVLIVVAIAGRDLYRHLASRGPWADPSWRTTAGMAYWSVLGVAFGAFAVADGLDSLGLVARGGGIGIGVAFAALGAHLAWQAGASWGYDLRQGAIGGEAARRRIEAMLDATGETAEAREEAHRGRIFRWVRHYDLAAGGSLAVDAAGNVLVRRRGVRRGRIAVVRHLAEAALGDRGSVARRDAEPLEGA